MRCGLGARPLAMYFAVAGPLGEGRAMLRLLLVVTIGMAAAPFAAAQQRWSWEEPVSAGSPPPRPPPPPGTIPPPPPAGGPPPQSAWVRLCETAGARGLDAFGKERQAGRKTCLTLHERIDGSNAMVLVAVGVRDVEGQTRRQFTILVPPGVQRQAGLRADFYPAALWHKVQSNRRLDPREESALKRLTLSYAFCHAAGCTVEMEATREVIDDLTRFAGLMVLAIGPAGQPAAFPVTLAGFREAHFGPPADSAAFHRARSQLIQQIRARQQAPLERRSR
jgi:invasion protein IalB